MGQAAPLPILSGEVRFSTDNGHIAALPRTAGRGQFATHALPGAAADHSAADRALSEAKPFAASAREFGLHQCPVRGLAERAGFLREP